MKNLNIIPFKKPDAPLSLDAQSSQKDLVKAPAHYVEGRAIEPIDVIEAWQIGHHLACVIKYISRAGRKNNALLDLNKALWYLNREINKTQRYFIEGTLDPDIFPCPQEISKDWNLSNNLASVLEMIWADKNLKVSIENYFLIQALKALNTEIDLLAQSSIN